MEVDIMKFRSHPASRQKEGFELHHISSKRWVDLRTLFELVSDVASESETRFVFSECDQIHLQCICIASQSSLGGSAQLLIWSSARVVWLVRRLSRVQHSFCRRSSEECQQRLALERAV